MLWRGSKVCIRLREFYSQGQIKKARFTQPMNQPVTLSPNCKSFCRSLSSLAAVRALEVREEVGGRVGGEGAERGEALEHVRSLLAAELLLHDVVRLVGELRRPAQVKVIEEVVARVILRLIGQ